MMLCDVWIFGDVWCRIWLAVDVWMCTASILNLCAISLDRYVAVTRPVTYPSIMSTRRAKSLIAGLWVLSFVICFPPLVGWKEQKVKENVYYQYGNYTLVSVTPSPAPPLPCPWTCELTNDAGYVVYSALGSFYIPMFVMLFFYWRIYRAAVRTTRAINQGFRTTKATRYSLPYCIKLIHASVS
uniref:G-protein coupled receptors family 1 profile domain-containing protein n=1 Tax=Anopheles minimus TaxID=112268 RepID=A0A182VVL1_9DIPT